MGAGAMALGGGIALVAALMPWWQLRLGESTTTYAGVRGWLGWIVLVLGAAASSAGLRLLTALPARRSLMATAGAGAGAGMLAATAVALLDRTGGLALDLGGFTQVEGLTTSIALGIPVAAIGAVLVLLGGMRASAAPSSRDPARTAPAADPPRP